MLTTSSEVYGTTSDFKALAEQNDVLYFDDYLNLPNGSRDCALNNSIKIMALYMVIFTIIY